jgi:hypothetical protein
MNSGSSAFIGSGGQSADALSTGALDHEGLDGVANLFKGRIDVGLQRHSAATAQALIGGHNQLCLTAIDTVGQSVWRKAAENDGMDGTDASAGQHGIGGLRDHRQIENDAIALANAHVLVGIGQFADLLVELIVGDVGVVCRIITLPDDGGLVAAAFKVAVDAVDGHVQLTVFVPLDGNIVIVEGCVLHDGVGLDPVDAFALLCPEGLRIFHGLFVHRQIGVIVDQGM